MAGNYGGWTPGGNAYDPYNPGAAYGYPTPYSNPYTPTNRFMPGQTAQPQVPTQLPAQNVQQNSNVPWIQVPNIEAARNVMVQPGQSAWIMNQNKPEFYFKAADSMGVATQRYFRFSEFNPDEEVAKEVLNSQAGNLVSREEFNTFAQNVAAQFNALQQGMSNGNMNVQPVQQQPVMTAPQPVQTTNIPVVPIQQDTTGNKASAGSKKKEATT